MQKRAKGSQSIGASILLSLQGLSYALGQAGEVECGISDFACFDRVRWGGEREIVSVQWLERLVDKAGEAGFGESSILDTRARGLGTHDTPPSCRCGRVLGVSCPLRLADEVECSDLALDG